MTAVLEPVRVSTLEELAETANNALLASEEAGSSQVRFSIECGEALEQARAIVPHGEWMTWLAANFHASFATAYHCMNLARNRSVVSEATSLSHALMLVRGISRPCFLPHPEKEARRREAQRLDADGVNQKDIAECLGVARSTVQRLLDPAADERYRRTSQRWKDARRALARQEREQAIKRALKDAPAEIQRLYAACESLQDDFGRARAVVTDTEAKRTLSEADALQRKMRDLVVKLLPLS